MKNLIKTLALLCFLIVLLVMGIANRHGVALHFDPINPSNPVIESWILPLYMVIFAMLLFGILIGGTVVWISQHRFRAEARRLKKQLRNEKKELVKTKQDLASISLEP